MPQPEHQIVGRVREWSGGWAARRAERGAGAGGVQCAQPAPHPLHLYLEARCRSRCCTRWLASWLSAAKQGAPH